MSPPSPLPLILQVIRSSLISPLLPVALRRRPSSQNPSNLPSLPLIPKSFKSALSSPHPSASFSFSSVSASSLAASSPPAEFLAESQLFLPLEVDRCVSLCSSWNFSLIGKVIEDVQATLERGPWKIGGFPLFLKLWEPGFKPSNAVIGSAVLWVTLPELPIEFYDKEILMGIGNSLEKLVKIDVKTLERDRVRFARLLVQVNISKPAPSAIWIGKFLEPIQIQEASRFCKSCKEYGHWSMECLITLAKNKKPQVPGKDKLSSQDNEGWTQVVGKSKLKPSQVAATGDGYQSGQSTLRWVEKRKQNLSPIGRQFSVFAGSHSLSPESSPPSSSLSSPTSLSSIPFSANPFQSLSSDPNPASHDGLQLCNLQPVPFPRLFSPIKKPRPISIFNPNQHSEPISISFVDPPSPQEIYPTWNTHVVDLTPPEMGISDLNPNLIQFMMETQQWDEVNIVPREVLRQCILNPLQVPAEWLEMKMLTSQGDLIPAHLPNVADLVFLSEEVKQFFFWRMDQMMFLAVKIETRNWTNVMKLIHTRKRERQIQLTVGWEFVGVNELERSINLSLEPRHYILFDQTTGQDREFLRIARISFSRNIRLLIQQHQPHLIVISEVRVSRSDTEKIVRKLPYDEWLMVEPTGFSGGIAILWRSNAVSFETTRMTDQGIHGILQFTWTNKRKIGPIFERLDKAWSNLEWISLFPSGHLKILPRLTSDHCPILLCLYERMGFQAPKPFRFEPM
uniref:DUF4283 domain-containing protein n=1 Tax=Chenopodium quinoa TaxID=63459 RepID=A0A803LHQ6_CHEQI